MDVDEGFLNLDDDFNIDLNENAAPFPTASHTANDQSHKEALSEEEHVISMETAEAPLRYRKRGPRVIALDETQELRNPDLAAWNQEYLANMAEAAKAKNSNQSKTQVRRNADFWIFGQGIGGVGVGIGSNAMASPLDMFSGEALLEALAAISPMLAKKRTSSSDESEDSEGRRVRARTDDGLLTGGDAGLDEQIMFDDDNGIQAPMGDEV